MAPGYDGYLQEKKLTFWLFLSVASVVIGQSTQFGYGMGVMTGPSEVSVKRTLFHGHL